MTYVNKASVTAIGVLFPVLAIMLLGARFSRSPFSHKLEIDDVLIIPAAALTVVAGIGVIVGAQMDIIGGHSLPFITPTQYEYLGKFEYAFWICHVLAIGFIKLSILFLFRRLFKGRSYRTLFDYANWTLIISVILWTVVFLFFEIFACGARPNLSWSSLQSLRGACVDTFALQTGCAVFSWVIDLAILIEPLFMVGSLNMKLKRKIQTSFIFLFSSLTLRMIVWIQIEMQGVTHPSTKVLGYDFNTADITGVVSVIVFWTYVEIGIGFIVACLPPSAAIIDKVLHSSIYYIRAFSSTKFFSSRSSHSRSGEWGNGHGSKVRESRKSLGSRKKSAQRSEDDIELVQDGERV